MIEEVSTVIVGAGPAGLAAAACLKADGREVVVLEARHEVGASWRSHYDRLHLHTVKRHSSLPLLDMPAHYPRYPSREQLVAYLEAYARQFGIAPRFGQRVERLSRRSGGWSVQTQDTTVHARRVVVASGYNRVPNRPDLPGLVDFPGEVLHSSEYRNGSRFAGAQVLVVGCGNSGAEIALDLHEHGARPTLVVRGPVHVIPRDLMGRPSQETSIVMARLPIRVADRISGAILRLVVGDLSRYGIARPKKGPIRMIVEEGRVSMLDVGTLDLIKRGSVRVVPGVTRIAGNEVTVADGRTFPVDAIVLATGYRPAIHDFIEGADQLTDARGYPKVHGAEAAPGLYFVGYSNPPTGGLREIAIEARRVARHISDQDR